jgi:predicted deacetylase
MSRWLDPLRQALDASSGPVTVFFRDDDVGWRDDRLFALLDRFADHGLSIDLAVIPGDLGVALARRLQRVTRDSGDRVQVHQHGFAHINHERTGRKCEFGSARTESEQHRDIEMGWQRLQRLIGPLVQPMFTPPWNRCTPETAHCLIDLGFEVLSRDGSATPLDVAGLTELPVHLDWHAHRHGVRLTLTEWGAALATEVNTTQPVGIMLHHAVIAEEEQEAILQLLGVLAEHDHVRSAAMMAVARTRLAAAGAGVQEVD